MVSKEKINKLKLCFRIIRPRIIFIIALKIIFRGPCIHLFFFSPFFSIFSWFLFHHLCFALAHFYFFYGVSSMSFGTLFSSHLPSSIRHLIAYSPLEKSFFAFALQCRGWSLVELLKEIIRLKGETIRWFSTSVKEWWKLAIFHFKRNYLNWRVIPCRKKNDLYLCSFSSFSQHFFFASWFLFRLNRIFQVHDMTINFSFVLFFFFILTICLLRATMLAIDGLPSRSISSHVRIILKG